MLNSPAIAHFPNTPWVYLFKDKKGQILYIGKARNLKKRVSQYFTPGSVWKQEMLAQAESVDFLSVENDSESLYLESNLIKKHLPPFNNMLKGANAYAYIKLSKHPIPQLLITRKKLNDGAIYIGPKHNTRELKKFLQYLRQIVQYRSCPLSQFKQWKLCSDFYFWLCKGRCAKSELEKPEYPQLITSFFKGNTKPIEQKLKKLIDEAVQVQNFEWAAKLRDIYLQIWQFTEKQSVEYAKSFSGYLLQIRELGSWRAYVLLHFFEGKMIDVIRHHFEKADLDTEEMLANFASEFGTFHQQGNRFATEKFSFTKEETARMNQLFDDFFQSYLLGKTLQGGTVMTELLSELQERYRLSQFPYQMECLDISHLSWDWTSGGISCLVGGLEEKKLYRKYKIQTVKNDDYLALQEVLIRRFALDIPEEWSKLRIPNLFILDWGKGQLAILFELQEKYPEIKNLFSSVQFVALGKWEARKKAHIWQKSKKSDASVGEKLYVRREGTIEEFDLQYDEADRLLTRIRDEAHRFANYYRKQQEKLAFKKAQEKVWK